MVLSCNKRKDKHAEPLEYHTYSKSTNIKCTTFMKNRREEVRRVRNKTVERKERREVRRRERRERKEKDRTREETRKEMGEEGRSFSQA